MTTWPTELKITRDNYKEQPPERGLRSNMDVGPDKLRKRSSAAVRRVTLRLFLTDAELDIFDEFFDENETLVFNFTDPRKQVVKRARFDGPPSGYDRQETKWSVTVKLEYLP